MRLANATPGRVVARRQGRGLSAAPMLVSGRRRRSNNEKGKNEMAMRRCRMPGLRVKGEASPAYRGP